jgi:hypothetical protein
MSEQPIDQQATAPVNNTPVVLRIVLAVLVLIPGLFALIAFIAVTGYWANEGFQFVYPDRDWMPLFIIPSAVTVLLASAIVGVLLRFARWKNAANASLLVSIISAFTIVVGYQLMLDSFSPDDPESPIITLIASIVALAIVAAPPFLHWWNAPETAEPPGN